MKTSLQIMIEAEELTRKFVVSGLPEEDLTRINRKRLIKPYFAPFSRNDPTSTHVGYEYFIRRGQITKDIISDYRKGWEIQTTSVADFEGKVTWFTDTGHCSGSWYAYLDAEETGIVYERTINNFSRRLLHKLTLGKYKPASIEYKERVGNALFYQETEHLILPACYEFALQRVTKNKEIKVLSPVTTGDVK